MKKGRCCGFGHCDCEPIEETYKKMEELFKEFLTGYLENVQKMLPESYRAQQLKAGGVPASLVFDFETRFLKEPFMKALRKREIK